MKKAEIKKSILFAVLAAALYAVSAPASKLLLREMPAAMMAALLYLGAGTGMSAVGAVRGLRGGGRLLPGFKKREAPYVVAMILLDIAAPVSLMFGLKTASAESASLLNNFEIVATSLIALVIFHEKISRRTWAAISLIVAASLLLSLEGAGSLSFSGGSLLVLLACVCWGFENNCTRVLSSGDPLQIVIVKGFGSGCGSLVIALCAGERISSLTAALLALLLGFVAYGLSIFFYVCAQRRLGAAKTSAYYAVAPFIGVALSFLIFRETPGAEFFAALALMAGGAYLAAGGEK